MDPVGANFHFNFVLMLENAVNQRQLRLEYRYLRDTSNPFHMPNEKFIKLFRLNKELAINLIEEIREIDGDNNARITKIPIHLEVLLCLNFYGHGSYQTSVGQDLNFAVSQPAVSRIISRICNIFATHLLQRYVQFPSTEQASLQVKQGFRDKLNFPNTLGAIDCTHVAIVSPKVDAEVNPAIVYLNRKGYHSINVQAICDADMIFLHVNARYPGATHDAAIWDTSAVKTHLQRRYEAGERNMWLIGDSGYPLEPWMMTPITDAVANTPEAAYTTQHCSTRNVIERAFGCLKQRFKSVSKNRTLHYDHAAAGRIIYACVVLHNICRRYNIQMIDENDQQDDENDYNLEVDVVDRNNHNIDILMEGRMVRRRLVNLLTENQ